MNMKVIGLSIIAVAGVGYIGWKLISSRRLGKTVKQMNDFIMHGKSDISSFDDISIRDIHYLIGITDHYRIFFKESGDEIIAARVLEVGTKLRSTLINRGETVPDYVL